MTTKLTFLGDVHACFGDLRDRMSENPDTDEFIQVGDMAMFWDGRNAGTGSFDRPLTWIGGNHDNWDFLNGVPDPNAYMPANVRYLPRPSRIESPLTINFLGGADSIDKGSRREGLSWWRDEVPSYAEFQAFADLPAADIIVTHTAPLSIVTVMGYRNCTDPTSKALQSIWGQMGYVPQLWFFGHWHQHFDRIIKGTRFICLPCVHDHEWYDRGYMRPIRAYKGVTVTVDNGEIVGIDT